VNFLAVSEFLKNPDRPGRQFFFKPKKIWVFSFHARKKTGWNMRTAVAMYWFLRF